MLDVFARVVLSCSERLPCPLLTSEQLGSLCHNWEGSLCDVAQHWAGLEEGETFLDEVQYMLSVWNGTVHQLVSIDHFLPDVTSCSPNAFSITGSIMTSPRSLHKLLVCISCVVLDML